jgi:hypothetical protein
MGNEALWNNEELEDVLLRSQKCRSNESKKKKSGKIQYEREDGDQLGTSSAIACTV